jgi:hypothetical protein
MDALHNFFQCFQEGERVVVLASSSDKEGIFGSLWVNVFAHICFLNDSLTCCICPFFLLYISCRPVQRPQIHQRCYGCYH